MICCLRLILDVEVGLGGCLCFWVWFDCLCVYGIFVYDYYSVGFAVCVMFEIVLFVFRYVELNYLVVCGCYYVLLLCLCSFRTCVVLLVVLV